MKLKQYCERISLLAIMFFVVNHSILANQVSANFTIRNPGIEVSLDSKGNLISLKNLQTGQNYASGKPMWRLYFDTQEEKENEVLASNCIPEIRQDGNSIFIKYNSLSSKNNKTVNIALLLRVTLEEKQVRFSSEIKNNELHTIVRELQYPLVANCQLPKDHQLLTTEWGGQIYKDPVGAVKSGNGAWPPYYPPAQYFLQRDTRYPFGPSANCYAFIGEKQGLYVGSHDTTFQDTNHGLRLYPSQKFVFDQLETGIYKYPNCMNGEIWQCAANVLAPYTGTWHETSNLYRAWVNTWWTHQEAPRWVKEMKSWQRIILKHQYGEVFFNYSDISTHIKSVGEGAGINTLFLFGYWKGGQDADNPNYVPDPRLGGAEVLKKEIKAFQKNNGKVLMYFNGRVIDKTSDYYRNGPGKKVSIKDNTGSEYNDAYKFRGYGTFTGDYNSRTFAVADCREPEWQQEMLKLADQALEFGTNSVFYDQLGNGDVPNWDLSKEFPIPNLKTVADKAKVLSLIHNYINSKNPEMAIGSEILSDISANHVDYIHWYGPPSCKAVQNPDWEAKGEKPRTPLFMEWFRFTFPEIVVSDRDIRDDTDIERRVNHTVLLGLRNDVEIYRCRALIDETPHYQAYLTKINQLKDRFSDLLLLGKFTDVIGLNHTNPEIDAKRFENGNKAAIVFAQSHLATASTILTIPDGYKFKEYGNVGEVEVQPGKGKVQVKLGKYGVAVVVLEKVKND